MVPEIPSPGHAAAAVCYPMAVKAITDVRESLLSMAVRLLPVPIIQVLPVVLEAELLRMVIPVAVVAEVVIPAVPAEIATVLFMAVAAVLIGYPADVP